VVTFDQHWASEAEVVFVACPVMSLPVVGFVPVSALVQAVKPELIAGEGGLLQGDAGVRGRNTRAGGRAGGRGKAQTTVR
jgi:hypothetical protein